VGFDLRRRSTPADAIHLLCGGALAGQIRLALGAERVACMLDSLATGPCRLDPAAHARARLSYWRVFHRRLSAGPRRAPWKPDRHAVISAIDLKRHVSGRTNASVIVWTGALWNEVLFSWWACDAVLRLGLAPSRLWLAVVPGTAPGYSGSSDARPVSEAFEASRPFERPFLRAGARLWRAFVEGDLPALAHAKVTPPLRPLSWALGSMIPQAVGRGPAARIGLSEYDRQLLECFRAREWGTALSRIRDPTTRERYLWLMQFGDLRIVERLEAWALHEPSILARRVVAGTSPFTRTEYRLDLGGLDALDCGLSTPRSAPAQWLGGYLAYGPHMRWLRRNTKSSWRLVPAPGR
jgi:hypothetical protein